MSRKDDLENHIRRSAQLIRQFEEILQTSSDPKEIERSRRNIADQWALIGGYREEYGRLVHGNAPEEIAEILARFEPSLRPDPSGDTPLPVASVPSVNPGSAAGAPPRISSCPFLAGPMLTDPRFFVGRQEEFHSLTRHMDGPEPVSVNVWGDRRIGKSSLLYQFFLTWDQRVPQPERFVVVYISLQDGRCQREPDFYRTVGQALIDLPRVKKQPKLRAPWQAGVRERCAFAEALERWRTLGVLLVLCLDEFEALLGRPEAFDDGFYDNLRAQMDAGRLMLIVSSHRPLDHYSQRQRLTSAFFNIGHLMALDQLREEEAADLARLPSSTLSGQPAALSLEEQRAVREWGERHPYRLQLAGSAIWHARQHGRDLAAARREFDGQARRLDAHSGGALRRWGRPLHRLFWQLPVSIGSLAKRLGGAFDDLTAWIIGVGVLLVLLLVLLGLLAPAQLLPFLRKALGLGG